MKVTDAVLQFLRAEGIDTVFSLMSEELIELTATAAEEWSDELRFVQARHEQNAVAMADGYARTTGDIGVAIVGRGPAIAQTATALGTAQKAGTPLLVVVPEPSRDSLFDPMNKGFRQQSFLESVLDTVFTVRDESALVETVAETFRLLHGGRGPVAVQVPWDVLNGEAPHADDWESSTIGSARPDRSTARLEPDAAAIRRAADRYEASEKSAPPVVIAGAGAVAADARDAIEAFAERTNAMLATTLRAQGYFADHPFSVGFVGGFGRPWGNEFVRESDYVLAVGCSLNDHTTDHGRLLADTTVVQVDVDPTHVGRHAQADLSVVGDATATVAALDAELASRDVDVGRRFWTDDVERRLADPGPIDDRPRSNLPDRMDPRDLMDALDRLLPEERLVVSDSGHFGCWVLDGITITDPADYVWPMEFGTLGLAQPIGIGTAFAYK